MQFADATKLVGVVITSSPLSMPAIRTARCRPAVPLETAVACAVPVNAAKSRSKRRRNGPSPSVPERRASSTSSSSRTPTSGAERPITRGSRSQRAGATAGKSRYSSESGERPCVTREDLLDAAS